MNGSLSCHSVLSQQKGDDVTAANEENAIRVIGGTARSMGIDVID